MRTGSHLLPRFTRLVVILFGMLLMLTVVMMLREGGTIASAANLSPVETRVLGQGKWLKNGPAAMRVIVTDHITGKPLQAAVTMKMTQLDNGKPDGKAFKLYDGYTSKLGTVDAAFKAPDAKPGSYQLSIAVQTKEGDDHVTQPIQLEESAQVMLTCDKPLYQPGQTIYMRALALDLATRAAITGQAMTFEVEDGKANKVFKKKVDLNQFGLASADFTLADEVNMGRYTLRAILPEGSAEKKVRVERYVLPKFKTALTTDKKFYLPAETVKGTVQADYFFGKPVAGASVNIDVNTVTIGVDKIGEIVGKTDEHGTFKFEYTLPNNFVGQPFEQGKATVEFHGSIKDTADHVQDIYTSVPVVKDPVTLLIVPESRQVVPGIANTVYIAVASPDGTPLNNASLAISTNQSRTIWHLNTDSLGLAAFTFIPNKGAVQITARVTTPDGKQAAATQTLDVTPEQEGVILRTSLSIAKVGQRARINVISSVKTGTVYLDVLRNNQTILTKALDVTDGKAAMNLPITHDMEGTCKISAYKILPNEDIIRDSQVMIVTPADDLVIGVQADKATYRPGEDAKFIFTVTDVKKHPILAALGIAVVDESVFALSELQPGLEKIYFTLEKELMEPKYEIHGITPEDLILPPDPTNPRPIMLEAQRQNVARVLFAAAPAVGNFDVNINTYQQRWEKLKNEVIAEMTKSWEKIQQALQKYQQKTGKQLTADQGLDFLVQNGYLKAGDITDRWGNPYKVDLQGAKIFYPWSFNLSSAGPDEKWGTADDITGIGAQQGWGFPRGAVGEAGGIRAKNGLDMREDVILAMPMAAPKPAMVPMPPMVHGIVKTGTNVTAETNTAPAEAPVRIREYFPETMYWNPSLITDEHGMAKLTLPLADSITTWRMSMMANSAAGQLGSGTTPLRVFQDFFVDIDLPIALTQHDRVDIPVSVYNYLPENQTVKLTLEEAPWFTLEGPAVQVVDMQKNEVKVVYFPITVNMIGRYPLTINAKGTKLSDAVRRSIEILPDGKEFRNALNDRLEAKVEKTVNIPDDAIDGASAIWVKLYPGAFSQVAEGLDGMLRMPYGCFEQTSSTTYPNVLVLNYLKTTKKINPELQMKAEQYINVGYQRLVTFECKNGGFSWFGNDPAHQILTAYGLLEFTDMSKVHDVDPRLIQRTQQWLANKQKADGTWEVTEQGIAEGIINRQTGALRATAYITWALVESGYNGPQVAGGVRYVKSHLNEAKDPYTLGVILNLLAREERDGATTSDVAQRLIDSATVTDKTAYWKSETQTFTGAKSESADMETTGMAAYGLAKWGRNSGFTTKVLGYLIQNKNSFGTWSSTQGTVWALKSLIYASSNSFGGGKGTVDVLINGKKMTTFNITAEDSDVMRQVDLSTEIKKGDNQVTLSYNGTGSMLYQIVSRYYLPWSKVETAPQAVKEPLSISVAYDKTTLAQNDTAAVTVTVKNQVEPRATVEMPLIDIGVPPGFTVNPEGLEKAVTDKTISKYTLAARQIIVYIEKLAPNKSVTLQYEIKAKYPIKARTPASTAYPYYNPEQAATSAPKNVEITK